MLLDVVDRVLHGEDLLGRVVGNLDAELFLERHDELDGVEAVSAQIVDEARVLGDLVGLDAQMLNNDLLHAICDVAHEMPLQNSGFASATSFASPRWQAPDGAGPAREVAGPRPRVARGLPRRAPPRRVQRGAGAVG